MWGGVLHTLANSPCMHQQYTMRRMHSMPTTRVQPPIACRAWAAANKRHLQAMPTASVHNKRQKPAPADSPPKSKPSSKHRALWTDGSWESGHSVLPHMPRPEPSQPPATQPDGRGGTAWVHLPSQAAAQPAKLQQPAQSARHRPPPAPEPHPSCCAAPQ